MKAARFTLLLLCLLALPNLGHAASTVWLEAEQFRNLGGWVNDAQFVDQMGSPYLLAIGLEGPVGDAVTPATIPAAGKYRLWVRSRDWVPEFSPGKFQVLLGGQKVEQVFGASKKEGWVWGEARLDFGWQDEQKFGRVPHFGVAEDECLTLSIGMRAPSAGEMLAAFAAHNALDLDEALRDADPDLSLPANPAEIDADAVRRARTTLQAALALVL